MTPFHEIPDDTRMAFLSALDDVQCQVCQYSCTGLQVYVGPSYTRLDETVQAFGWTVTGLVYFPLGSDNPPDHMRHAVPGKYDGARGFWLIASVACSPCEPAVMDPDDPDEDEPTYDDVDHGDSHDFDNIDRDNDFGASDGSSYSGGYRTFSDGSYREDFRSDC